MKNWVQRYTLEIIIGALIVGIVALSAFTAKGQVPPTAAEIIDAIQYLSPSEQADVAEAALCYAPPLTRVALLSAALYDLYGYTGADTVLVDSWSASYDGEYPAGVQWVWSVAPAVDGPWTGVASTDSLRVWLRVRGEVGAAPGLWSVPGKVE